MKLDLDAIRADDLVVKIGGTVYAVKQLDAAAYISTIAHKERLGDDAGENITVMREWIAALAPEIPVSVVKACSLKMLYTLLNELDTFQGGVGADEVGNVEGVGGSA